MKLKLLILLMIPMICLTGCGESAASYNNQGNRAYEEGKYTEAQENYRSAHQLNPDLPQPYYNAGNTYHRQDNLKSAVAQAEQAIRTGKRTGDSEVLQQAYYNQGNNFFAGQNFGPAIEAYKDSLRLKPDDADAKNNLELALKMQQQQQQQSQQQQQGGGQQPQQGQQGGQPPPPQQGQGQGNPQQQPGGGQPQDQPGGGSQSQPDQQPQSGQSSGELTPQEAQQLLDALGQNSQTLQERLDQTYGGGNSDGFGGAPKPLPAQDW
jgi:Ca-activated chloride channel homolog